MAKGKGTSMHRKERYKSYEVNHTRERNKARRIVKSFKRVSKKKIKKHIEKILESIRSGKRGDSTALANYVQQEVKAKGLLSA